LTNLVRAVMSPDARLLGVSRSDATVDVWNIDAGKLLAARTMESPVTAMAFSANDRRIALGTEKGAVELWTLKGGQVTRFEVPGAPRIRTVSFSQGNQYLRAAVAGRKGELVWDLRTNAPLSLPAGTERFWISPDGKTLATLGPNYTVQLWDLPELRERVSLKGHRWTIYSLAFSADSALLATGGGDAIARLWDTASGRELIWPLRGHLQGVTEVTFSPDKTVLATGSTDGCVKLWHVATGRELLSACQSSEPVFSPDGNTLTLKTGLGLRFFHVPTLSEIDESRKGDVMAGR
jgi:WD40 repeat protein